MATATSASTTKQIFLQLDTASLELRFLLDGSNPIPNDQVLDHTIINKWGSMSLGKSIASFDIDIEKGDIIYFTLLPLQLFTNHRLAFNYHPTTNGVGISTFNNTPITSPASYSGFSFEALPIHQTNPTSFGIVITATPQVRGKLEFSLHTFLTINGINGGEPIDLCIDPQMQIQPLPDPNV